MRTFVIAAIGALALTTSANAALHCTVGTKPCYGVCISLSKVCHKPAPPPPPPGATAECRDHTYTYASGRHVCANHGGVLRRLPGRG